MLFVNDVAGGDGHLAGIFVYDFREMENPVTVFADKGRLSYDTAQETLLMDLADGWVIRWGKEPDRWHTIRFKTYQLPLELFDITLKGSKSEGEMSLPDLLGAVMAEPLGSERFNRLMVELSQRFSMPVGAFLLCLLAIPLGLNPRLQGRTWGLILGIMLFIIYYILFTASWRLALNARLDPALAPWLPNLLFAAAAPYFWWRMLRELPLLPGLGRLRRRRRAESP
jgi:lipopolysaccharide export system permease protein